MAKFILFVYFFTHTTAITESLFIKPRLWLHALSTKKKICQI